MAVLNPKLCAETALKAIAPYCIKSEISGGVRRGMSDVKSVDIVAVPDKSKLNQLRDVVNSRWGKPKEGSFPSKYTRIVGLTDDIRFHWVTVDRFGSALFMTTGDKGFVARAEAYWKKKSGGYFTPEFAICGKDLDGSLVEFGAAEEIDVFNLMEVKFIDPKKRNRN